METKKKKILPRIPVPQPSHLSHLYLMFKPNLLLLVSFAEGRGQPSPLRGQLDHVHWCNPVHPLRPLANPPWSGPRCVQVKRMYTHTHTQAQVSLFDKDCVEVLASSGPGPPHCGKSYFLLLVFPAPSLSPSPTLKPQSLVSPHNPAALCQASGAHQGK